MGILGGIAAPAVSGRTGDGHRCDSRRFGPSACYAYSVCRRFDPGDLRPHVGGLAWQRVMVLTQMSVIAMLQQLTRRKLKTVVLENECIARITVLGGARMMVAAGTPCHWL